MAKVTITITDTPRGVSVKLDSDEPIPENHVSGSIAQVLGLFGLAAMREEVERHTVKPIQIKTIQ